MLEDLKEPIRAAARSVAFRWPGVVEADDLEQEIWVRLLESPGYTDKVFGMDANQRMRALKGIGHQLASQEREEYAHFTGNFHYSTNDVRDILQRMSAHSGEDRPDSVTQIEEIDITEGLIALGDVSARKHAVVLAAYFGEPIHEDRKELMRAVDDLTKLMNRAYRNSEMSHEGPGARKVISNEHAYHITRSERNDEVRDWSSQL